MSTIIRSARIAAAAVGTAAIGILGFAGTASAAAEAAPVKVCSPLGCEQQYVEVSYSGSHVVVTASDKAAGASLIGRISSATGQTWTVLMDDNTQTVVFPVNGQPGPLNVSACASTGGCGQGTVPAP